MLKNHLKMSMRALAKSKLYALINIVGLAVSLTAAILLSLWVWHELSFDTMHSKLAGDTGGGGQSSRVFT